MYIFRVEDKNGFGVYMSPNFVDFNIIGETVIQTLGYDVTDVHPLPDDSEVLRDWWIYILAVCDKKDYIFGFPTLSALTSWIPEIAWFHLAEKNMYLSIYYIPEKYVKGDLYHFDEYQVIFNRNIAYRVAQIHFNSKILDIIQFAAIYNELNINQFTKTYEELNSCN